MNTKTSILKLVDDTAFFPTSCEEQMHIVQLMTELCGDDKKKLDMMEEIVNWVRVESAHRAQSYMLEKINESLQSWGLCSGLSPESAIQ